MIPYPLTGMPVKLNANPPIWVTSLTDITVSKVVEKETDCVLINLTILTNENSFYNFTAIKYT